MPIGSQSLQTWISTVYTSQVASTYKANIDACTSIASNVAGAVYVYPNNPAGLSVLVDPAFNLWSLNGGGTNSGPFLFNGAASPATVSLAAPVSNSYYATIYWNPNSNTAGVVYGATGASPTPILPDDAANIPMACVLLTTGQSQVQANNISDVRSHFRFGPVRYSNLNFNANVTLNLAGASSVIIELGVATSAFTLTLTNLQVGIPMQFIGRAGTATATVNATTPGGVAYTLQTKQAGTAAAFVNFNPFSTGAAAQYSWGPSYTYYHSGAPEWSAPFA